MNKTIDSFIPLCELSDSFSRTVSKSPYPQELEAVMSEELVDEAANTIRNWTGYEASPLISLSALASELPVSQILYKDESERFGLGSFKALGGSYAVSVLANSLGGRSDATVATATDGNHGRSVAWGAERAGIRCVIYIHKDVSDGRKKAMEEFGAEVVRIDGDYDDSVRQCAHDAEKNGWQVVSDTSWDGYQDVPRTVMAGYGLMVDEILTQSETIPSHVIIQAGVGGLAAAVSGRLWQKLGEQCPKIIIVESEHSACVLQSARNNAVSEVPVEKETIMAGLSCGAASPLAWEILSRCVSGIVTIPDTAVPEGMRMMASGEVGNQIEAGECALPGIIALAAISKSPDLMEEFQLDENSTVLLFGCEGATDPEIYQSVLSGKIK